MAIEVPNRVEKLIYSECLTAFKGTNNAGKAILNLSEYKEELKKTKERKRQLTMIPEYYTHPKQTLWTKFISIFK